MTNLRKLKVTPKKSSGAIILFSIQGRSTNFPSEKPITINIQKDKCYDVIVVCGGNNGNSASAAFEAVHKDFGIFLCDPNRNLTWTPITKLEAKVPSGAAAWLSSSMISIRRKSEKPKAQNTNEGGG